jgi:EPS-associated MarR family transcriptional regulator
MSKIGKAFVQCLRVFTSQQVGVMYNPLHRSEKVIEMCLYIAKHIVKKTTQTKDTEHMIDFHVGLMVASVQHMNISALETDLRTLQVLAEQPQLNQRELASQLGVSLGKVNYCLRALLAKGFLKAQNFKSSKNKLAYAYVLTPAGITARAELTAEFLEVKLREYERLSQEITALKAQAALESANASAVRKKA